jgi:hypothetical protein
MTRTTIEIPEETKEALRDARLAHESNYGETIDRLLQRDDVEFVTEREAREIADEKIADRVIPEAQR